MTLHDGYTLINNGTEHIIRTPLAIWDNLSMMQIITGAVLLTIISWFITRMIKGRSYSEIAVSQEEYASISARDNFPTFSDYETNGEQMREVSRQTSIEGTTEDWNYDN